MTIEQLNDLLTYLSMNRPPVYLPESVYDDLRSQIPEAQAFVCDRISGDHFVYLGVPIVRATKNWTVIS